MSGIQVSLCDISYSKGIDLQITQRSKVPNLSNLRSEAVNVIYTREIPTNIYNAEDGLQRFFFVRHVSSRCAESIR